MNSARTDNLPAGTMGCAVCGRILDRWDDEASGESGWMHGSADADDQLDHDPVPASVKDLRPILRCDFCMVETQDAWIVRAAPFKVPRINYVSSEDWISCQTCAEHVRRQSWKNLESRSFEAIRERRADDEMFAEHGRAAIRAIHSGLRSNLRGRPERQSTDEI